MVPTEINTNGSQHLSMIQLNIPLVAPASSKKLLWLKTLERKEAETSSNVTIPLFSELKPCQDGSRLKKTDGGFLK